MREIKFRGKTEDDMIFEDGKMIDKGTWVYGSLIVNGNLPYIVGEVIESDSEYIALEYWYPCDKSTIGQFTGLKDKNGVEIYEGDALLVTLRHTIPEYNGKPFKHIVKISETLNQNVPDWWFEVGTVEIIGNIHDKENV